MYRRLCHDLFQSLFYWITYSYSHKMGEIPRKIKRFNPYFTGLPILMPEEDPEDEEEIIEVSILILLDYLFLYSQSFISNSYRSSFNPYFTGLPILIKSKWGSIQSRCTVSILILLDYLFLWYRNIHFNKWMYQFQSLFYWITYSYQILLLSFQIHLLFQSLFYWITYSYFIYISSIFIYFIMFQSLFYWITYSYLFPWNNQYRLLHVSILILLDYLFLCSSLGNLWSHLDLVSILILLDYLFLYSPDTEDLVEGLISFNPYFTGLPILIP